MCDAVEQLMFSYKRKQFILKCSSSKRVIKTYKIECGWLFVRVTIKIYSAQKLLRPGSLVFFPFAFSLSLTRSSISLSYLISNFFLLHIFFIFFIIVSQVFPTIFCDHMLYNGMKMVLSNKTTISYFENVIIQNNVNATFTHFSFYFKLFLFFFFHFENTFVLL